MRASSGWQDLSGNSIMNTLSSIHRFLDDARKIILGVTPALEMDLRENGYSVSVIVNGEWLDMLIDDDCFPVEEADGWRCRIGLDQAERFETKELMFEDHLWRHLLSWLEKLKSYSAVGVWIYPSEGSYAKLVVESDDLSEWTYVIPLWTQPNESGS